MGCAEPFLISRKRTCSPSEEFAERSSTIEGVPRSFLRRKDLVRIDLEGSTDWGDEIPSLFLESTDQWLYEVWASGDSNGRMAG